MTNWGAMGKEEAQRTQKVVETYEQTQANLGS